MGWSLVKECRTWRLPLEARRSADGQHVSPDGMSASGTGTAAALPDLPGLPDFTPAFVGASGFAALAMTGSGAVTGTGVGIGSTAAAGGWVEAAMRAAVAAISC